MFNGIKMTKIKEEIFEKPVAPMVKKVAIGKSLTSLRGIISEGEVVTPLDFAGGQETFNMLIENGYIR